jgi:hypothetical protein
MEDRKRTLVVLLSMHRCGSSLATSILHRMGMSLGPFELMDAASSNPHGHFESLPFYHLNRQVQKLVFGFADDLPESPEVLSRLTATQGEWPAQVQVPEKLFDEGRSLIGGLIESGEVSGFKDPRTVLTWPYWQRVLEAFPGVRVVPVNLLRSPHEIAMSLVTRRYGWIGYWASLDVVAVHLRRQQAILKAWGQPARGVCFGSPTFMEALVEVTHQCGLRWDANLALTLFDQSCVHHVPAAVPHEAQSLFDALHEESATSRNSQDDGVQLVNDSRFLEELRIGQWQTVFQQVTEAQEQAASARLRADQAAAQLRESEARLEESRLYLLEAQRAVIENQLARIEAQQSLRNSQERELQACQNNDALRTRLERYESHPILAPAIWGRRHLRSLAHSIMRGPTSAARRNGLSEPGVAPARGRERESL